MVAWFKYCLYVYVDQIKIMESNITLVKYTRLNPTSYPLYPYIELGLV